MATVELNPGAGGATIGVDDCGADGNLQLMKLAVSTAADATPIPADANGLSVQQATAANLKCTEASGVAIKDATEATYLGVLQVETAISDGNAYLVTIDGDTSTMNTNVAGAATSLGTLTTFAGNIEKTEDVTHSSGDKGIQVLAVRRDTPAVGSSDNGDYSTVNVDANGLLWTNVGAALPAGTNAIGKLAANSGVDIGDVDVTTVTPGTGATNLGKAEDGGHTSGDVGVMALGVRNDTPNVALTNTDLDYSPITTYRDGSIRRFPIESDFAVLGGNQVKKYYTNAGAVTDGIIWSPAAGKRWYVTDLIMNISAAATITFEDDKAGGDEAVMKFELAANSGVTHRFETPLFSGEDAADLMVTTSAGNIYITVVGYEI